MTALVTAPTASQWASAALHLERRPDWRYIRIDGVRYAVLASGNSGRTYQLRADAAGCSCCWYQKTGTTCSHMLALELDALEIELSDAAIDAVLGPAPKARPSYADLFPGCRDCGDLVDGYHDGRCRRCGEDAEWQARRDARAS